MIVNRNELIIYESCVTDSSSLGYFKKKSLGEGERERTRRNHAVVRNVCSLVASLKE